MSPEVGPRWLLEWLFRAEDAGSGSLLAVFSSGSRSGRGECEDLAGPGLALVVIEVNADRPHRRKPCHQRLLRLPLTRRHAAW